MHHRPICSDGEFHIGRKVCIPTNSDKNRVKQAGCLKHRKNRLADIRMFACIHGFSYLTPPKRDTSGRPIRSLFSNQLLLLLSKFDKGFDVNQVFAAEMWIAR